MLIFQRCVFDTFYWNPFKVKWKFNPFDHQNSIFLHDNKIICLFIIAFIILIIFRRNAHVWNVSSSDNDPNFYDQIWAYVIPTFSTANCSDKSSQRYFQSLENGCSSKAYRVDWIWFNNYLNNHELSIQSLLIKLNYLFKCLTFIEFWIWVKVWKQTISRDQNFH